MAPGDRYPPQQTEWIPPDQSLWRVMRPSIASRDGIEPVLTIIRPLPRVESLLTLKTSAPFGQYPSDDAFPAGSP
jgi:hypothetical protein